MQILNFIVFLVSFSFNFFPLQCTQISPSPMPASGGSAAIPPASAVSPVSEAAPPSPVLPESPPEYQNSPPLPSPSPSPVTEDDENGGFRRKVAPAPAPEKEETAEEEVAAAAGGEDGRERRVRWCAVREGYEECQSLVTSFKETRGYSWTCIEKDTTEQCLESIKNGKADIINIEAGMAYTAFTTFSMKAIANEVYCDQTESYNAVILVNRKACQQKKDVTLMDFNGRRSCHGGHSTAAGWNFPIHHINKIFGSDEMNGRDVATKFFSKVCAPSEFEQGGVCSGCGNENGTCDSYSNSLYSGHSGAFRCLVEEMGDVAFVRGDTALLYSLEGPYNQSWSTKSIRDFMYLCPNGGCREINGYPGSCSLGRIPANVIMSSNSIPNEKKSAILQTLTNATWRRNGTGFLLSPSMQQLSVVKKLTRSYLGNSALVSQSLQESSAPKAQPTPVAVTSDSGFSVISRPGFSAVFSVIVTVIIFVV